jgi:hypothetical protein
MRAVRYWRRRQKKVSDAMNRAIDEAVEKFNVATGINTECIRGRLKASVVSIAMLIMLVVVGQPRFGAVRGHAPAKAFVEVLGTRFRTFVVSEYNTSKRCDVCGAPLIKTRAHSAAVSKRRRKQPNSDGEGEEGEAHESDEATSIDEL